MIRWNTRSLVLLLILVTAVAITITQYVVSRRDQIPQPSPRPDQILLITDRAGWDAAIKNSQCIVLVDGAWNIDTARFRGPFKEFASWCHTQADVQVLTMIINPEDTSDEVWKICQELWSKYNVDTGGLRNYGGAGRVLWLRNRTVVDYAWCMEFMNGSDTADTKELLTARTKKAFE